MGPNNGSAFQYNCSTRIQDQQRSRIGHELWITESADHSAVSIVVQYTYIAVLRVTITVQTYKMKMEILTVVIGQWLGPCLWVSSYIINPSLP